MRVGVMDTGISLHNDLKNNYYFIDGTENYSNALDFLTSNTEDPIINAQDAYYHGTHVAGIIGAEGNNDKGISGVNWNVSLVQMRVGESISFSINAIVNALKWATDNWDTNLRSKIINFSGAGESPNSLLETAIRDYCNKGGLFICSAGNDPQDNDLSGTHVYPSFYGSQLYGTNYIPNIITVGNSDNADSRYEDANWGSESIDIYAPGVAILSTVPMELCGEYMYECNVEIGLGHYEHGYHHLTGSSMSTPYVAGVAALLLSVNPNLTAAQIENCIINGANTITIDTGDGENQSVKRLNAWGAFKYLMNNYPIYERNIGYVDGTGSYNIDADAPYMKDNTMMVKYNIQNPGNYTFTLSANSPIEVKLYNSNLEEIVATQTQSNNGCEIEFTHSLSTSTYYIKTNYISDDAEGTISVEIDCPPHTHEYSEWAKHTSTHHIERCSLCGQKGTATSPHVIKAADTLFSRANCMLCGQWINLDDTIVMVPGILNIQKVTVNGSYILPNGIIVLVDEDIEAYLNGTLVFYDKDNLPQTQ